MKTTYRAVIFLSAMIFMGIDMPSCPGQQALQQQVEALQNKQSELTRLTQTQESHIKSLNTELGQTKTLLAQVSQTVLAQKDALERLEAGMKSLTDTLNAMNKPKAGTVGKGAAGGGKPGATAKPAAGAHTAPTPAKKKH